MPGDDRISELPEDLINRILSYLQTGDSVKTSVLSSRWKNLWLNVPVLDLDCSNFPYKEDQVFFSFVDRFFELNPELNLRKLEVKCRRMQADELKDRICTAIGRGVQHLVVKGMIYHLDSNDRPRLGFIPLNLYTCKTLVSLKLEYSGLPDPGVVSMPCLKFMYLEKIMWIGTMDMEKLISGCPVLEELTFLKDLTNLISRLRVTRVRSRTLKSFCVLHSENFGGRPGVVYKLLEIDAPALEYMSIQEDIFERCVVKNLTSLYAIDLDFRFLARLEMYKEIRNFLTGISSVRDMTISDKTVRALHLYSIGGLVFPEFSNLSRLQAVFPCDLLQFLPAFLKSYPNLKHLILKVVKYSKEIKLFSFVVVPRCFLSTLECIEIKGFDKWEREEKKMASLFLENSAVLKKLIVSFADHPRSVSDSEIYEELNKFPKCSQRCQIIIDY